MYMLLLERSCKTLKLAINVICKFAVEIRCDYQKIQNIKHVFLPFPQRRLETSANNKFHCLWIAVSIFGENIFFSFHNLTKVFSISLLHSTNANNTIDKGKKPNIIYLVMCQNVFNFEVCKSQFYLEQFTKKCFRTSSELLFSNAFNS